MSLPSSPSASGGSSRMSTLPKPDQHQLTPRSKVKALLAAIDDDSSSERETSPRKLKKKDTYVSSVDPNATNLGDLHTGGGSGEEESDEAPIVSRGGLAARLYRRQERTTSSCASGDDNVYERIKNQLLPKTDLTHQAPSPDALPTSNGTRVENISTPHATHRFHNEDSSTQSTPRSKRSALRATQVSHVDSNVVGHVGTDDGSSSDLPAEPQNSDKLKALVARKRDEFRAREMAKKKKVARKNGHSHKSSDMASASVDQGLSGISEDSADDQVGEGKLTQKARSTRKASKKALQEMNRETQRMSRNMQLAHQAKTRKKITKESFFSRFSFQSHTPASSHAVQGPSSSTVASSAPPSDKEAYSANESPPTSPLRADDVLQKLSATKIVQELPANKAHMRVEDIEAVLPSNLSVLDHPSRKLPKRAENSSLGSLNEASMQVRNVIKIKCPKTVPIVNPSDHATVRTLDFESDIEIMPRRNPKRSLEVFDRLPMHGLNEDRSLQNLRALAHLNSPGKRLSSSKATFTMSEMQSSLQRKARKQAAEERAARIRALTDRGIIVPSAEERENDQAAIEDLVEKARQEAASIMQKEKDAVRKEKIASGGMNNNDPSSDEDEDFEGDDEDESDVDFSGSSHEGGSQINDDIDIDEDTPKSLDRGECDERANSPLAERNSNRLRSADSCGDEKENEEHDHIEQGEDEPGQLTNKNTSYVNERRRRKTTHVIEDDDDSMDEVGKLPACVDPTVQRPFIPGLAFSNGLAMGMTQAFAATMADLQSQAGSASAGLDQDSLNLLGSIPEPNFPVYDLEDSEQMVLDSQTSLEQPNGDADGPQESSMEITIDFSQSQIRNMTEDSQGLPTATQTSEIPDPTQDVGFEKSSPIRNRFVSIPPSTVDTVILSGARNTPVVRRKGRLRRRTSLSTTNLNMIDDAHPQGAISGSFISANAFDVLKKGAEQSLKAVDMFDKKQSEARAMVEEQAQESEDEYAGLGGASDDESAGEEDEEIQKMIDEGEVEVDERELAAFYANKERASDEKAVQKLFKDLNNGGLRRKRGAEFDLSDSDDDGEARRRAKRREFAKMRKALFENENIGKIAEDPKKLAFLRAIEDREDEENYDLFDEAKSSPTNLDDTQANEADHGPQPETDPTSNPPSRQRPLQESLPDKINRPSPTTRRSRAFQKPSSLADIRASVSFLLEEPDSNPHLLYQHHQPTSSPPSSDTEAPTRHPDLFNNNNNNLLGPHPTTTIIDRLSLKRAESASIATTTNPSTSSSRLAFHDPARASSSTTNGTFKVPTLLRRATTTSTLLLNHKKTESGTNTDPRSTTGVVAMTERAAGKGGKNDIKIDSAVRMGGTRKSSVGYFASQTRNRDRDRNLGRKQREEEKKDKRRKEGLKRWGGNGGGGGEGLRALVTGTFD